MDNLTLMEDDPFVDLNEYELEHATSADLILTVGEVIGKILEYGVIFIGVVCSFLLMYVICKYKHLQTRQNWYIFHYALVTASRSCCIPLFEMMFSLFIHHDIHDYFLLCVTYTLGEVAPMVSTTFSALLLWDWFIWTFLKNNHCWNKFLRYQGFVIGSIYAAFGGAYIYFVTECFGDLEDLYTEPFMIFYWQLLADVVLINLYGCCRPLDQEDLKSKFVVAVANYVVLSWLPMILYYHLFLSVFGYYGSGVQMVAYWLDTGTKLIVHAGPIFTFLWLRRYDQDLNKAFGMAYSRTVRRGATQGYESGLDGQKRDDNRLVDNFV